RPEVFAFPMIWCGSRFFFSSRRRHTRSKRDWSSDVCSSDLNGTGPKWTIHGSLSSVEKFARVVGKPLRLSESGGSGEVSPSLKRSEERRVGKECRSGDVLCH